MAYTEPCIPSGVLTTTAAASVVTRPAHLCSVMLHPGTAACTLTIYDNSGGTASGTVLALLQGLANGASVVFPFDGAPVLALKGISYVLSGAASQAEIYYRLAD